MSGSSKISKKQLTISELYLNLTPAQREEAEYFLRRYIDLIKRIHERVEREKQLAKEQSSESSKTDKNLTD